MDIDLFFEIIKHDTQGHLENFKSEISQNAANIIAYMFTEVKREMILYDPLKTNAAVILIKHLITILPQEENCEFFIDLIKLYTSDHNLLSSLLYRELFHLLNRFNKNQEGYVFFSSVSDKLNKNKFLNSKAYAVYFAYQLKHYNLVDNTLNTLLIQFQSESYLEAYDFCMLNFYKGLILLSLKKFQKSSLCFLAVFKICISSNMFIHFHVESMKRLILLSFLVDPINQKSLVAMIGDHKDLLSIKPLEVYNELYNKFGTKTISIKEIEKYVANYLHFFRADKTNGIVRLCVQELICNKIKDAFKSYRRIKFEKLSSILNIEKSTLINHLKCLTKENKLQVLLDEVKEIVQIKDQKFDETNCLEEIKTNYQNIIDIEKELINLSSFKSGHSNFLIKETLKR